MAVSQPSRSRDLDKLLLMPGQIVGPNFVPGEDIGVRDGGTKTTDGFYRCYAGGIFANVLRMVNLLMEYILMDPFMNGFAELQDRHGDMRLDVDNMSYEELLALEDRIGNVSTGLSDKHIRSSMKQRMFDSIYVSPNLEPCCICQATLGDGSSSKKSILQCKVGDKKPILPVFVAAEKTLDLPIDK